MAPTPWRSHYLDPTGYYYMGTRYYDPQAGQFLSPDPAGHGSSPSLYDYADGDPVNRVDPTGRFGVTKMVTSPSLFSWAGMVQQQQMLSVMEGDRTGIRNTPPIQIEQPMTWRGAVSMVLDYIPVIGTVKMAMEAITGYDIVGGRYLSPAERVMAAAGVALSLIPGGMAAKPAMAVIRTEFSIGAKIEIQGVKQLGSRGVRNSVELTEAQQAQLYSHVDELGLNRSDFLISSHMSSYSPNFDRVFLGPNAFPVAAEKRIGGSVFERLSPRAVVAHEGGHLIADRAGRGFPGGSLLDETQASLIARDLPGLNKVERYQLLRDAAERAKAEGTKLRNLLPHLNYQKP